MASSTQHPGRDTQLNTDAMRALAHPLRVRILDELSMYGPLTASGLAERLGESSGATSYHLRQLEKHGLVREEVTKRNARERWWERPPGAISISTPLDAAPGSAERLAAQLVGQEFMRGREENLQAFLNEAENVFGREWLDISTADTVNLRLTPDQLHALVLEVDEVFAKYIAAYKTTPTPGARPVQIHLNAFPLVRGEVVGGEES
jgi:DNA-binding transcriptional ArsR family regulator